MPVWQWTADVWLYIS